MEGDLERYILGLSTKVLNERLRKLHDYELVVKTAETIPPGYMLNTDFLTQDYDSPWSLIRLAACNPNTTPCAAHTPSQKLQPPSNRQKTT